MTKISLVLIALASAVLASFPARAERAVRGNPNAAIARSEKINPHLRIVAQELNARGAPDGLSDFFVRVDDSSSIQVYIHSDSLAPEAVSQFEGLGARVEIVSEELSVVQAWVPYESLDDLAALSFVRRITPPSYGVSRLAQCVNSPNELCMTEGDAIHRADELRALGFDGTGAKVGVISDGADSYCDAVDNDGLPNGVTFFGTCNNANPCSCNNGDEGTAMMEIVHDMAPGAQLAFGAGLDSTAAFIQRVEDLMTTFGADVIVDDLGFFLEPYFEDGGIAQKVEEAVTSGVLYASAAGNEALDHYEGDYVDSGDGLGSHLIGSGNDVFNVFGTGIAVIVQWTNAFGASGDNYDLCLESESAAQCANFNTVQNGDDDPVEWASLNNCNTGCAMQVRRISGNAQRIELFVLGGSLSASDRVTAGSIFGHPCVVGAMASAAIDAADPGNDDVESYSSQGPCLIRFPGTETRDTPDISASDGVEVGGFGGFPSPFFGTSAAAPHVAAAAAQLLGGFTTASEVRTALMDSAVDIEAVGFDALAGAGRMDVFAAAELLNDAPDSAIDTPGGNVTILQGQSVNLTGTCTDPNGTTGMTFLWTFEGGSGISNKTVEDPGLVQFNNVGGFDVNFTCTDGFGLSDPVSPTRIVTVEAATDTDGDGIPDATDNCPNDSNSGQTNTDGDAQGDACDTDDDNDGVLDSAPDNCPLTANSNQANNDGDAQGDVCDTDDDNDGIADGPDNCDLIANAGQADADGDGLGDPCDANDNDGPLGDLDSDGVNNATDNCPNNANANQADADGDSIGDVCDPTPGTTTGGTTTGGTTTGGTTTGGTTTGGTTTGGTTTGGTTTGGTTTGGTTGGTTTGGTTTGGTTGGGASAGGCSLL